MTISYLLWISASRSCDPACLTGVWSRHHHYWQHDLLRLWSREPTEPELPVRRGNTQDHDKSRNSDDVVMMMPVCFRCLACVSSVWRCNWCPLDQLCTHNHSCPNQHIILNQRVRPPVLLSNLSISCVFFFLSLTCLSLCQQDSPGPTSCPLVFALQSSALVPLGMSTTVVLRGRNLDIYTVRTTLYHISWSQPVYID